jgi:hypothetical protein
MGKQKYGHLANLVGFTNISNKKRKAAKFRYNEDKESIADSEDKDCSDKENVDFNFVRKASPFERKQSPERIQSIQSTMEALHRDIDTYYPNDHHGRGSMGIKEVL